MHDSDWLKIKLRLIFLICVQTQILCNGAHICIIGSIPVLWHAKSQIRRSFHHPTPFSSVHCEHWVDKDVCGGNVHWLVHTRVQIDQVIHCLPTLWDAVALSVRIKGLCGRVEAPSVMLPAEGYVATALRAVAVSTQPLCGHGRVHRVFVPRGWSSVLAGGMRGKICNAAFALWHAGDILLETEVCLGILEILHHLNHL